MSQFLQISIGVIPAFLILLIATIVVRRKLIRKIVTMVVLACVALTGVYLHTTQESEIAKESVEEAEYSLDMVYALLSSGNTDEAVAMLDEMSSSTVYINDYALCNARLYVLEGNYTAAKILYEKAIAAGIDDTNINIEYELVCTCLSDSGIDREIYGEFAEYLDYGADADTVIAQASEARSQIVSIVSTAITACANDAGDEILSAANYITRVDELYNAYLSGEQIDTEEISDILKAMNKLAKKEPELFRMPNVRMARMKLQILDQDFEAIAKAVDEYSSYDELLVVSELYINQYIKSSNFNRTYGTENTEMYEVVLDTLEELYKQEYSSEDSSFRKQVKKYMSGLEYNIDNPALAEVERVLAAYADTGDIDDRTKIYLQLARLAQDRGSDSTANSYISDAMNTVGDCTDSVYTDAMYHVIGIINDKDDTEALKNIAQYVEDIVKHSTTLELVSELKEQNPDTITGDDPEQGESSSTTPTDFNTYFSDYVSQKRTSLNIISLDASNFPEITFELGVDGDIAYSADQLRSILSLKDCGADIGKFTVEDVSYDKVNIVLVCDTSGSMSGDAIINLKQAVSLFLNNKTEKENIGLVTFESYVTGTYGLDTSVDELNSVVSSIYAGGGTNMYDAVIEAITLLTKKEDQLNVIILLSDGNDGYSHSTTSIYENIVVPCLEKETLIYSIGLGDSVDSAYLNSFAEPTGGSYLYVSDSQTLTAFYDYLHNLLANRYKVTFTAYDTFTTERTVKISVTDDELSYDTYNYSLNREDQSEELTVSETIIFDNKVVSGLETRLLYKSKKDQTINLLCANFTEDDKVSVQFKDTLTYNVNCTYVASNYYEITIPSSMVIGEYDMIVTVNGHIAYFENELIIGDEEQTVEFGGYTFTATVKETSGDTVRLSGGVCLNGWLYFNGSVTFTGDIENGTSIVMYDGSGAYIKYSVSTSTGLAKYLATNDRSLNIGMLGSITLYNDLSESTTSDSYRVDKVMIPTAYISNVFTISTPSLELYPYKIVIDFNGFTTKFPYQDDIVKKSGISDVFKFDVQSKAIFTNMNIGMDITVDTTADTKIYHTVNLGAMPMYYSPSAFKLHINTIEGEYEIKLMAKLAFLDGDGVGLQLKWDDSLVPDEVRLFCDFDIETNISGIPVTFSDFELAVSNITNDGENAAIKVLNWTFEGVTKISVAKVSDELPKLEKYVGDVAVCAFRDTTLSFSLGQRNIEMSTEFYMFDKIEMGSVSIECGRISYSNLMLNMPSETVNGMVATVWSGLKWTSNNCSIDMGSTSEIALTDKFIGATVKGNCDIEVKWWVFSKEKSVYGEGLVGMYIDHSGNLTFTVRARAQDDSGRKGINLTWSKANGGDIDTKYY